MTRQPLLTISFSAAGCSAVPIPEAFYQTKNHCES